MTMKRRTFLVGSVSGLTLLTVAACTPDSPQPSPSASPIRSKTPEPAAFVRTNWAADPFSRGALSYPAVGTAADDREILRRPIDDRLFFAGEHTAETAPATVQGARASGRSVAFDVMSIAEPGERIAIVGAGIAGATAARILVDSGYDVVVIEGRDRLGGRVSTLNGDDWPFPLELGADVISALDSAAVLAELADANIDVVSFTLSQEHRTVAGEVLEPSTVGQDAVAEALEWAAVQPVDTSLADALLDSGAANVDASAGAAGVSQVDLLENYVASDVVVGTGADADELSAWFASIPVLGAEGDEMVVGDFESLIVGMIEGITVLPSSTVSGVTLTDRGVSLRLARGESYSADRTIVTVPLGVLQAGAIEFDPPLPFSHRGAIAALGMGHRDKIVMRFDTPFWSTDASAWSVVDGDTDFPLWINMLPLMGEPILVGLMAGEAAVRLSEFGDRELMQAALVSLEPFVDPDLVSRSASPSASPSPSSASD
ncbi:flavin monoamine oxidase family protein [Salinibacterium hongtaonis]|uniref:Oxidoreductase n=1 Tax=Homoserinimonas hongtaonis TaxID=2079791 RepID=A0A2U1SY40_9MICO|nr:FAD-dependent oxidoreductase [Salinibacterium hongtaonis]PWB96544.1 oxidoreductase [Salinibacterium hongtaonis]